MLDELARVHPVELMILNTIANVPLLYVAFALAARTQNARQRAPSRTARLCAIAQLLAGGLLWGLSTLVDRAFTVLAVQGSADLGTHLLAEPAPLLFPMACAIVLPLIRNDAARGLALLVAVLFATLVINRLAVHPGLLMLDAAARREVWTVIAIGTLAMGLGAGLMTTWSQPGRVAAVLLLAWGTKLLIYARLAAMGTGVDVLRPSTGLVTPLLLWSITLGVFAIGFVAFTESRRLRSSASRRAMLARSEERMSVLANATQEGLVIHAGGVIVDANDRFRDMIGGDDPRGEPVDRYLPARGNDGRGVQDEAEHALVRSDGRSVPVETACRSLDDERTVIAVRDMSEKLADRRRIRELAANDGLTGLLNRRSFDALLEQRIGRATGEDIPHLALLMIDLDRFKPINDTYGHAAGDAVLRAVARRFARTVRGGDTVARIGGDEFAVLAQVDDEQDALALAERLREAATDPVETGSARVEAGASIGVALAPRDASDDEELRHAADVALYEAKRSGRDRATLFEPGMAETARARLRLETDLRRALARDELELYYQVQHDLKAGGPVGYEALMRWRHPERGMVSPGEFIPIAEETGLIVAMGRWAVERAARDIAALSDEMRVSVNVSPVQFERGDVVSDVRHALRVSGLAPARLEIEVTEQLLIADTEGTLAVLSELRAMGVTLSLDDFGSGYSSLAYLTRFPFSKIKIDRQFVDRMASDERSHALVRSILALASSLGLRVTAEGVETHVQLATLTTGRCDEAQGYLLGRPTPFSDLLSGNREADLDAVSA